MPKITSPQFLLVGLVPSVLALSLVHAQDQGAIVHVVEEALPFRQPLGVEVTGTAILNPTSKEALPVQVLDRRDIERLGVHTSVALLQRLAVMANTGELGVSMLRPGPETAAIHGYEAGTLVLLNGRRLGIYPMQMISANADLMLPDLGKVPLRSIERVEVLTDGASTRYGSDAIAGVLNIITRQPFDGWEIGAAVQSPQGAGGTEKSGGLSWGRGGKRGDTWGLQWHLSWRERDGLVASQRKLVDPALWRMGSTESGESVYALPSAAWVPFGAPAQAVVLGAPAGACVEPFEYAAPYQSCLVDNGSHQMVYPSERQVSLFASWEHHLGSGVKVFADALINDYSKRLIRASPMGEVRAVDTLQPHLLMAEPLGLSYATDSTLSRVLSVGSSGHLGGADYKLTWTHAHHLGKAVSSGGGVAGWAAQLQLTADELRQVPSEYSAETLSKFELLKAPERQLVTAQSESHQVEALLSGQWDADSGLERRWAVGGSFLQDGIQSAFLRAGVNPPAVNLKRRSAAMFGEVEATLSERWLAGMAIRHDHYNDMGGATTGKVKAQWRFSSQGFVRMGWGTGFRAPSLRQMNPQQVFSLAALPTLAPDSCDYSAGYAGRVDIIRCSGSEVYTEGNADLKPERSQSVSLGVRHEPNAQWSWGADYWSLHVKDIFGSFNFNDILADPNLYAQYATLPALGSPERIRLVAQNLGRLDRRGIDYDLHYRRNTDWGRFRASLRGTHYLGSRRAFAPGEPPVNELANYVYQTERYVPRNKFRLQLQLDKPQWNWTAVVDVISGNTERVDGITAAGVAVTISRKVPMHWTMGLMAKHTPSRGVELYAGIDNVFDRLPPARYASPASQGFVPGLDTRYGTYWGRTFKLGLNLKF